MHSLIVTHPGKAHFDEFFAVSLVMAVHNETDFSVQRRNPTKEELNNSDIWVIDVGERYEPALRNFDHHQDLDLHAGFVLVADYLNLTDKLKMMPWWTYKDKIDRYGPFKMAGELGIEKLLPIYSPVEIWLLAQFEQDPEKIGDMMRSFGQSMIRDAELLTSQFDFWKTCNRVTVKGKIVLIGLTDDSTGSQRFSEQMDIPASIAVTYDGRGKGWRLSRLNDAPGVDFSRLINHRDILFAHKTGFVAKTRKRLPLEAVLKLVEPAVD